MSVNTDTGSVETDGEDEEYSSIIEYALDRGYIVQSESGLFRFVETGFLADREEMRGFLKGIKTARYMATGNYPTWENQPIEFVPFTDECHESVIDPKRKEIERLKQE